MGDYMGIYGEFKPKEDKTFILTTSGAKTIGNVTLSVNSLEQIENKLEMSIKGFHIVNDDLCDPKIIPFGHRKTNPKRHTKEFREHLIKVNRKRIEDCKKQIDLLQQHLGVTPKTDIVRYFSEDESALLIMFTEHGVEVTDESDADIYNIHHDYISKTRTKYELVDIVETKFNKYMEQE